MQATLCCTLGTSAWKRISKSGRHFISTRVSCCLLCAAAAILALVGCFLQSSLSGGRIIKRFDQAQQMGSCRQPLLDTSELLPDASFTGGALAGLGLHICRYGASSVAGAGAYMAGAATRCPVDHCSEKLTALVQDSTF